MSTLSILAAIALAVVIVSAIVYFVFPSTLFDWLIILGRRTARLKRRSVQIGSVAWPYLEGGPADGEVLLLVHGFGAEKDHWLAYARFFGKRFRVLIPDLPGFGEATRCAELDYGVDAQAERLESFLDGLGVSHLHVCGNSMGGYVLLKLALSNPRRITSMTLLNNAGVIGAKKSELERAAARGENLLRVESMDDVDRLLSFATHKPLRIPGRFKKVIADRMVAHHDFLDRLFQQISLELQETPLNSRLTEITVPTLVIWGSHDRLVNVSCVTELVQHIRGCQSVVFDDVGHMPMIEAPGRTAGHHLAFLDRLNSEASDTV